MSFDIDPADDRQAFDECIAEIHSLKAQLAERTRERDKLRKLINDDYRGECLPECNSYGHAERCAYSDFYIQWEDALTRAANAERALADARKDAERLDWLDKQRGNVVETETDGRGNPYPVLVGQDWYVRGQCATVREAIDSAIEAEKEEHQTSKHVCGEEGYSRALGDKCPACVAEGRIDN